MTAWSVLNSHTSSNTFINKHTKGNGFNIKLIYNYLQLFTTRQRNAVYLLFISIFDIIRWGYLVSLLVDLYSFNIFWVRSVHTLFGNTPEIISIIFIVFEFFRVIAIQFYHRI